MKFFILLILAQATALCDGGALLLRKEAGQLAVTVFASPAPLSVGVADISVLLQDRRGLEPVLDADVSLILRGGIPDKLIQVHPTHQQAQNKLLYAAPITLTHSGKRQLVINILRNSKSTQVTGSLDVGPERHTATSYLSYLVFPPVVIVGFAARELLIARQTRKRLNDARLS